MDASASVTTSCTSDNRKFKFFNLFERYMVYTEQRMTQSWNHQETGFLGQLWSCSDITSDSRYADSSVICSSVEWRSKMKLPYLTLAEEIVNVFL
jgi:hypothetical protein